MAFEILKITGAEWNRFYTDKEVWPDDVYHDDVLLRVNGVEVEDYAALDPNAAIEVECGYVDIGDRQIELIDYFISWKTAQTTDFCTFEAPKELMQTIRAAVLAAGGRICTTDSIDAERDALTGDQVRERE